MSSCARLLSLRACLVAIAACSGPSTPEEWETELRGKRLLHVRGDDATRRDVIWLCENGTALGRWNATADDSRGPTGEDEVAAWSLREEAGRACISMSVDEGGLLIDSPCVEIVPDGDGFWLEDRRWVVTGDAGC